MLEVKEITKNKSKFIGINNKYHVLPEEYLKKLSEKDVLFQSPASTNKDMNGAYPGGLIELIFIACKHALAINKSFPENLRIDDAFIIKTLIISQMGKCGMFEFNQSEWHRTNLGKIYNFTKQDIALRYNEVSLRNAIIYGIKLTDEQYQAILNIDKPSEDLMSQYHSSLLTNILKTGLHLGIIEQKEIING